MSAFLNTWTSRIVLAGATLAGTGLGYEIGCPEQSCNDSSSTSPEDEQSPNNLSYSYEISSLGRQVIGPLADGAIAPITASMDAKGTYQMTYVHRVQERDDSMYEVPWQRGLYSRKTLTGKAFRGLFLSKEMRSHPIGDDDQISLRRQGAASRSIANGMMILPYLMRLGINVVALSEKDDGVRRELVSPETGVIVGDSVATVSHMGDFAMYSRGLGQIARGNEVGAVWSLTASNRWNIVSNAITMGVGGLRLYVEHERKQKTGHYNSESIFYGCFEIASSAAWIILSAYLLKKMNEIMMSKQQAPKENNDGGENGNHVTETGANNTLLCITKLPLVIQDGMRAIYTLGASVNIGINGAALIYAMNHAALSGGPSKALMYSATLGMGGSLFWLGSAYTSTPTTLSASRVFALGTSLLIAAQTAYDKWPLITHLMGIG